MDATRLQETMVPMHTERQPVAGWVYGLVAFLWGVVVFTSVGLVSSLLEKAPADRSWSDLLGPVIGVVAMGLVTAFISGIRVSVDSGELTVKYGVWPWLARIALGPVTSCRAVTYRPLAQFGGWGIRRGAGGIRAYTARGNRGVLLTLNEGRRVLIGSDAPEALVEALGRLGVTALAPADDLGA